MYIVFSFITGLVFGLGLIISGMASPVKVLAFLDVSGRWDPSLLLVMGAAVVVTMIAFAFSRKRTSSLLGTPMHLPQARDIDRRLVGGSIVFGIGWGLAGFCPGPALVALTIIRHAPAGGWAMVSKRSSTRRPSPKDPPFCP